MNITQKKWDPFDVKAEVQRRGLTMTGIAKNAGLYEGACRQGLIGNSRAGAQAIADALGIPFRELFPTLYPSGRHNEGKTSRTRPVGKSVKAQIAVDDRQAS